MNWTKRVVYYILSGTPQVVVIHFWSNHRGRVFWENHFFSVLGDPKTLFSLKNPTFGGWGVIILELFNQSYGFRDCQGWLSQEIVIWPSMYDRTKRWLFMVKQGFRGSKKFFLAPPKQKKLIFSKNPTSVIWPKVDYNYLEGTWQNVVYHPLGSIYFF